SFMSSPSLPFPPDSAEGRISDTSDYRKKVIIALNPLLDNYLRQEALRAVHRLVWLSRPTH
ncbi:MAG: hypothetical protein V3T19_10790, partial [Acidiferrobacterales bacterium]